MADEEEDQGWKRKRGGSPFRRGPSPMIYSSYRNSQEQSTAFKTETFDVPDEEVKQACVDYMRQYPPAGYGTELLSQVPNLYGTTRLVFRRYPSAD